MELQVQIPTITMEQAKNRQIVFIDVRTPKEFEKFHIPNAVNLPLFSNEERVLVGTTYKQVGQEEAKVIGIDLLSTKLPSMYQQLKAIHEEKRDRMLVVYCWRGGMRSKSIVTMMSTLGLPVVQLQGGIRAYRQLIEKQLREVQGAKKPFIVLSGNTGTGKTRILTRLAEKGYPVIDLEGLVNHRGSIFGHIGKQPSNQKQFEEKLAERFRELKEAEYYIIEAESRRIGIVQLPDFLIVGKERGIHVHIEAPLSFRIETICEEYQLANHLEAFLEAVKTIEKRLSPEAMMTLQKLQMERNIAAMVELLLTEYYDPRYAHSNQHADAPFKTIAVTSIDAAVARMEEILKALTTGNAKESFFQNV